MMVTGMFFHHQYYIQEEPKACLPTIMKSKFLLATSFIFLTIVTAHAQIKKGIYAGTTFTNWRGDATESLGNLVDATNGIITTEGKTGFFAGAFVEIPIGENISIQPGATYAQKGYAMKGDYSINKLEFIGVNASAKVNSQYIDLPLLLKVQPAKGLEIFAGPQVSFLLKSEMKLDAGALGFSFFKKTMDMTDQINPIDMGLTGGIGYAFDNGFFVSASYDHGLSKLDKNENFKAYNQAFKAGIGYKF